MSNAERLQTWAGAKVDSGFLRVMEWAWSFGNRSPEKIIPARHVALDRYTSPALLENPMIFYPEPPAPSVTRISSKRVGDAQVERFRWRSGYRTYDRSYQSEFDGYQANQMAYAETRFIGADRPTVICLHPWMVGSFFLSRQTFQALYEQPINIALITLPFHGPRNSRLGGPLFPGRDLQRTNEGFGQLVWDVRSLLAHLIERTRAPIGVVGMSLGGYGAALLAGIEPRLRFSVPIIPFIDLPELMWWHGKQRTERLKQETEGLDLAEMQRVYSIHNPLRYQPLQPKERRMVVAGRADRICHPDHAVRLWKHWDQPELYYWAGSHVLQFGRDKALTALMRIIES